MDASDLSFDVDLLGMTSQVPPMPTFGDGASTPDFVHAFRTAIDGKTISRQVSAASTITLAGVAARQAAEAPAAAGVDSPMEPWFAAKVNVEDLNFKLNQVQLEQQKEQHQQGQQKARQPFEQGKKQKAQHGSSDMGPRQVGLVLRDPIHCLTVHPVRHPPGLVMGPPGLLPNLLHSFAQESPPAPPPPHLEMRPTKQAQPPIVSMGTVGHPKHCAAPCDLERCLLGSACLSCHLCGQQRGEEQTRARQQQGLCEEGCPSIGSMGHPVTCEEACKFAGKPKGCKDGPLCVRCHSCRWGRHRSRR
mmetsp:Transcript_25409/g.71427  ORF Transcript_25409/g.71427 Transcript_25409/m.71427 type:complete len:304 (+) Transcript_25409:46-957(+)